MQGFRSALSGFYMSYSVSPCGGYRVCNLITSLSSGECLITSNLRI